MKMHFIDPAETEPKIPGGHEAVDRIMEVYQRYKSEITEDSGPSVKAMLCLLEARGRTFRYDEAQREALLQAVSPLRNEVPGAAVIAALETDVRLSIATDFRFRRISPSGAAKRSQQAFDGLHDLYNHLSDLRLVFLQGWYDFDETDLKAILERAPDTDDPNFEMFRRIGSKDACLARIDSMKDDVFRLLGEMAPLQAAFQRSEHAPPIRSRSGPRPLAGLTMFLHACGNVYYEATGKEPRRVVGTGMTEGGPEASQECGAFHSFVTSALTPVSKFFGNPSVDYCVRRAIHLFNNPVSELRAAF